MKRPYHTSGTGNTTGDKSKIQINRYVLRQELEKLFREANVLYWARSLMKMTYSFIDHAVIASPTPPPFKIPRLRFVEAGLALAYTQAPEPTLSVLASPSRSSTRMTGAYLLEEKIICDSDFTKFVHNSDCAPLLDRDEDGYDIAEFLCFTQHVQYVKTKGLVYIADYQGAQWQVASLPY